MESAFIGGGGGGGMGTCVFVWCGGRDEKEGRDDGGAPLLPTCRHTNGHS